MLRNWALKLKESSLGNYEKKGQLRSSFHYVIYTIYGLAHGHVWPHLPTVSRVEWCDTWLVKGVFYPDECVLLSCYCLIALHENRCFFCAFCFIGHQCIIRTCNCAVWYALDAKNSSESIALLIYWHTPKVSRVWSNWIRQVLSRCICRLL